MSSSDSESSSCSSSDCATGWPWQIVDHRQSESDEFDSSSENSSDQSSVEETTNDSWTNRRNIFISVYKTSNYKDITLITNYNELHNYRDKYTKLSKKNAENIKNIWSEVKVNVPELGIIPLKSYEKELIEDPKTKNKTVKKPATVNGVIVDKTKSPVVTQNQSLKASPKSSNSQQVTIKVDSKTNNKVQVNATNVDNKNIKEKNSNGTTKSTQNSSNIKTKNNENVSNQKKPAETPTKTAKPTAAVSTSTKVDKQDKGVKVDIIVLNVTKSESDKKNKQQSTNSTVQLNGSNKNVKNNSNEREFKKSRAKSDSKRNKNSKNNTKEVISESKSRKQKQKNSNSQSSENSDTQKRSSSVDSHFSHSTLKDKFKKKIEESDNDTTDSDDEDEEIIDNMDELTGNSKAVKSSHVNNEMTELIKCKDKMKPVETPKVAEKKTNEKDNNEQNAAGTPVKNDINLSTSEKNNIFNSEKFAEESVDMIMDDNLTGGLESLVEAMQYNPGDDRHYLNRCYCYLRMNKTALALADAQYVLQTSSHYGHRFIAYLRAGKASMALQKYTQAENYFKDSLSINSDNVYAQRELVRAKIARIVSLGYTERNAVIALLKYSKTQEAINYLANKNIAKSDSNDQNCDDIEDSDDLVYSSDVDEKPNCTSLINNMLSYEPIGTKLFHIMAKPINMTINPSLQPTKNANGDTKKKNTTNGKTSTGQIIDKTIWVGSLTKNITEAVLKKKFKQFGNVVSVYCPPNEAYAFVNFEKSEHVTNVLQNPSAHEINGHKLVIRQGIQKK